MKKKIVSLLACVALVCASCVNVSLGEISSSVPPNLFTSVENIILDADGLPKTVLRAAKHQNSFKGYTPASASVKITAKIIPYDKANKPKPALQTVELSASVDENRAVLLPNSLGRFHDEMNELVLEYSMSTEDIGSYFIHIRVESTYIQAVSTSKTIAFSGTDGYYLTAEPSSFSPKNMVATYADAKNNEIYIANSEVNGNVFRVGANTLGSGTTMDNITVNSGQVETAQTFGNHSLIMTAWKEIELGRYRCTGTSDLRDVAKIYAAGSSEGSFGSELSTTTTTTAETTTSETTTTTTTSTTSSSVTTTTSGLGSGGGDGTDMAEAQEETTPPVTAASSDTLLEQLSKYSADTNTKEEPEALGAALLADHSEDDSGGFGGGLKTSDSGENISFFDKAVGNSRYNATNIALILIPALLVFIAGAFLISNYMVKKGDREFIR